MNFEERFKRLVEKHESLTQTVELLARKHGGTGTEQRSDTDREDELHQ